MSDDKAYGELDIQPELNWAEIRKYQLLVGKKNDGLKLHIVEERQDTEEGEIVKKTCRTVEVANWESSWNVFFNLKSLAEVVGKNHRVDGEIMLVAEYPEFGDNVENEAIRYSISEGTLYAQKPSVRWSDPHVAK